MLTDTLRQYDEARAEAELFASFVTTESRAVETFVTSNAPGHALGRALAVVEHVEAARRDLEGERERAEQRRDQAETTLGALTETRCAPGTADAMAAGARGARAERERDHAREDLAALEGALRRWTPAILAQTREGAGRVAEVALVVYAQRELAGDRQGAGGLLGLTGDVRRLAEALLSRVRRYESLVHDAGAVAGRRLRLPAIAVDTEVLERLHSFDDPRLAPRAEPEADDGSPC